MRMGAFKFVTRGDSSRHGDVSLDDAVLEPPPVDAAIPLVGDFVPIALEHSDEIVFDCSALASVAADKVS